MIQEAQSADSGNIDPIKIDIDGTVHVIDRIHRVTLAAAESMLSYSITDCRRAVSGHIVIDICICQVKGTHVDLVCTGQRRLRVTEIAVSRGTTPCRR